MTNTPHSKKWTDVFIKSLKPDTAIYTDSKGKQSQKAYRLPDPEGYGLFIEVSPKGKKVWRFRAKGPALKGGSVLMTLGEYPVVTLRQARQKRDEMHAIVASGRDPRNVLKQQEQEEQIRQENNFANVCTKWLKLKAERVTENVHKSIESELRRYVLPVWGDKPVTEITGRDVFELLKGIEKKAETVARRVVIHLEGIFRHCIKLDLLKNNPASGMAAELKPHKTSHFARIGIEELPDLIEGITNSGSDEVVKSGLMLTMLLFTRKAEILSARWSDIDLEAGRWVIPAERMKMGRKVVNPDTTDHIVMLPHQAITILRKLFQITGRSEYVLSIRRGHPLSIHTLNHCLNSCGFKGRMTIHGFRSLAVSWLDEQEYNFQAIERQLAHKESNRTVRSYHRADFLEERARMLQAWADYIDSIRSPENSI